MCKFCNNGVIETYVHLACGYNPFLIRDGWQIAMLNYLEGHNFDQMDNMEVHRKTDEAFVLLAGAAILIASSNENGTDSFEVARMRPGVVYNIPAGVWHNIAMNRQAHVLIVEKDGTHLDDVEYVTLLPGEHAKLTERMNTIRSAFSEAEN